MKRFFAIALIFIFLIVSAYADNRDVKVYITETGDCYHRYGCSHLKSCIEITLEKAANNSYRRCSRCDPPIPDFKVSVTPIPYDPHSDWYNDPVDHPVPTTKTVDAAITVGAVTAGAAYLLWFLKRK